MILRTICAMLSKETNYVAKTVQNSELRGPDVGAQCDALAADVGQARVRACASLKL